MQSEDDKSFDKSPASDCPRSPAGKPGMVKAGKVILIVSLVILILPFAMFAASIPVSMLWVEFAGKSTKPPFLIELLPWSLFLVPFAALIGIVGAVIGYLVRRAGLKS